MPVDNVVVWDDALREPPPLAEQAQQSKARKRTARNLSEAAACVYK
jgi:hypothetical protein